MSKKQKTLTNFFGFLPPTKKRHTWQDLKKILFSKKWNPDVSWLEADEERTEMWFKFCTSHPNLADKTAAFYTGSKNFNHSLFDKHGVHECGASHF